MGISGPFFLEKRHDFLTSRGQNLSAWSDNDYFTISFFGEDYREDLKILGTKSKRNGDKLSLTKLTPEFLGKTITFKEAEYTLVCKKIYYQDLDLKHIPKEIIEHYYTEEAPHRMFVGEVLEIREK